MVLEHRFRKLDASALRMYKLGRQERALARTPNRECRPEMNLTDRKDVYRLVGPFRVSGSNARDIHTALEALRAAIAEFEGACQQVDELLGVAKRTYTQGQCVLLGTLDGRMREAELAYFRAEAARGELLTTVRAVAAERCHHKFYAPHREVVEEPMNLRAGMKWLDNLVHEASHACEEPVTWASLCNYIRDSAGHPLAPAATVAMDMFGGRKYFRANFLHWISIFAS
jgi:hypothetical protein